MSAAQRAGKDRESVSTPGDTIAELLTPPGAGAIGVVRVSGLHARRIVNAIGKGGTELDAGSQTCRRSRGFHALVSRGAEATGRLSLWTIFDDGEPIDDVIVSTVPNAVVPTIDLCAHGGIRVLERILRSLQRQGALIADVGKERRDAFDAPTLLEREINAAIRLAKTETAVLFLARQRVLALRTLRELAASAQRDPRGARAGLERLHSTWPAVRILLRGATVALVGLPNAGKSTLFNVLTGRTVAVASPIAGTTRDWVTAEVEFDGVPITLIDTPGDRATVDPLEAEAIRVGRCRSASADLRILLQESPFRADVRDDHSTLVETAAAISWRAGLVVQTKIDLDHTDGPRTGERNFEATSNPGSGVATAVRVSANLETGLEELRRAVLAALSWNSECLHAANVVSERQAQIVALTLASPDNMLYRGIVALINEPVVGAS